VAGIDVANFIAKRRSEYASRRGAL